MTDHEDSPGPSGDDGPLRDAAAPASAAGPPATPEPPSGAAPGSTADSRPSAEPRPWLERIGLAAIALVMGALLTVMAIASWTGGEWILAAMSASGAILTVGVAVLTLVRG